MDHLEKFVHMPVRRAAPSTPVVPVERVRRPEPEPEPEGAKTRFPSREAYQASRRAKWPRLAELYAQYGNTRSLLWYARHRDVELDHSSVINALKKMGLYQPRELTFQPWRPYGPPKKLFVAAQRRARIEQRRSAGYWSTAPRRALTPAMVREIRRLAREGLTIRETAERLNVGQGAVGHVRAGTSWAHLT